VSGRWCEADGGLVDALEAYRAGCRTAAQSEVATRRVRELRIASRRIGVHPIGVYRLAIGIIVQIAGDVGRAAVYHVGVRCPVGCRIDNVPCHTIVDHRDRCVLAEARIKGL
jgi:hypothetical protein